MEKLIQFSFKIDKELQAKFKIKCIQDGKTQQKKLNELIRAYVEEKNQK
jgi:uncharacterized protein (DUF4415 family)